VFTQTLKRSPKHLHDFQSPENRERFIKMMNPKIISQAKVLQKEIPSITPIRDN